MDVIGVGEMTKIRMDVVVLLCERFNGYMDGKVSAVQLESHT